jgi:RNA polymerase sigma factor (sigma-70 family)
VDGQQTVAALRSGDEHSLGSVYDAYAPRLYDYAFGLLRDREGAEDAVHDALLVAIGRADTLREPKRVTAWLYAIIRNECIRQARRSRMASHPRLAHARDETLFLGADLQAEQARAWTRDAAFSLSPHLREALDLEARHGFDESELATILGISSRRVAAHLATARADLAEALDAMTTARSERGRCAALDALLAGWDGHFTRAVLQQITDHADDCRNCWRQRSVDAVQRYADLPAAPVPMLLRGRLLATAAVPHRIAYRSEIAEPFHRTGFPVPFGGARRRRRVVAWIAAAAVLIASGGVYYLVRPEETVSPDRTAEVAAGGDPIGAGSRAGSPTASASASPSASPSKTPSPSVSPSASPSPSRSDPPLPSPAPQTSRPGGGSDAVQIDAVLADSTVGCSGDWTAAVTANVRGDSVRRVTFSWGLTTSPNRTSKLGRVSDSLYQGSVEGLPSGTEVYWRVTAQLTGGLTASSPVRSTRHC